MGKDADIAALLSSGRHEGLETLGQFDRTPLLVAAAAGQASIVARLVAAGADVNARDSSGKTPLLLVSEAGLSEALEALLTAGSELNLELRDSIHSEQTALHLAAAKGGASCTRLLLDAGADATAGDKHQRTPLHLAALAGQHESVAALLRSGRFRDVDAVDLFGCTALQLTPQRVDNEAARASIVQQLVAAGAACSATSASGEAALSAAAGFGSDEIVGILLACDERAPPASMVSLGRSAALTFAVANGRVSTARMLVAAGANVSSSHLESATGSPAGLELLDVLLPAMDAGGADSGRSAFAAALRFTVDARSDHKIAVRLLEAGADPAAASKGQSTLLMAASSRLQMVGLLPALLAHERCPNVNAAGTDGSTALHLAARAGNSAAVQSLLAAGADASARKSCGSTVLMEAARARDGATVRTLLASGQAGDVCARNAEGYTALRIAARHGNGEAISALFEAKPLTEESAMLGLFEDVVAARQPEAMGAVLAAGDVSWLASAADATKTKALLLAAQRSGPVLEALLEAGLQVDTWPERCQTPLIAAATAGCVASADVLLRPEHGVAIEAVDASGFTALSRALAGAKDEVALRLLKAGASPCATALVMAISQGCGEPVISAMLAAGAQASIDAEGRYGLTPLLAAVTRGRVALVKCLVSAGANVWTKPALCSAMGNTRGAELADALLPGIGTASETTQDAFNIALRGVAEAGRTALVKLLAERGADVCSKNRQGETALHLASGKGHFDVVDMLLNQTAARSVLNDPANNGHTAVMKAIWLGKPRVVARLLRAGATLDLHVPQQPSALALAAGGGHASVVKVLLASGLCDLDGRDGHGPAPLALAVNWGLPEVTRHLLAAGADAREVPSDCTDGTRSERTQNQAQALRMLAAALEGGNLRFVARKCWGRRRALVVWRSSFLGTESRSAAARL